MTCMFVHGICVRISHNRGDCKLSAITHKHTHTKVLFMYFLCAHADLCLDHIDSL